MNRKGLALFTDTATSKYESGTVYLNSLMFAARSLTDIDIAKLGVLKRHLTTYHPCAF